MPILHVSRPESGVIAIVVTLAVSTFLLGIAALAVDLGQAHLRQNDLQSLADRLALAGAKGLPVINEPEGAIDQLTTTLSAVCASGEETGDLCPAGGITAAQWTDGDPTNGELTFFADPDADGAVTASDVVSDLSTPSQALRVLLPPATVQFGLAGVLGFDSAKIQRSATARVGTPLGSGLLPFALTPDDVARGTFCIAGEPALTEESGSLSASTGTSSPVRLTLRTRFPDGVPATGADASVTLTSSSWSRLRGVSFEGRTPGGTERSMVAVRTGWRTYRITVPPGEPGSTVEIRAHGRRGRSSTIFTTAPLTLTYTGSPPATDPITCDSPLPILNVGDLERSIRSGPTPPVLDSLLNLTSTPEISDALTKGLLQSEGNRPGRLIGDTGHGTLTTNGYPNVDATDLFRSAHLIDQRYGSVSSLKSLLQRGSTASPTERGWITAAAVRSHRLAVLPVMDDENLEKITSFRYIWIDGDSPGRGLLWEQGYLTGLEGYVIDPGYLPAVVSGSGSVGPYLGSGMPKEALLTSDLDSRPG
ncbi:Tad domain-containing protein [Kineosporia mesophila]|uniref:Tad domain-containing protein n=1 Tax=Kineosporia mesophila TaxID=566012 RepID=UPI001E6430B1|nr:Tad domain-containing protein [Kineosporia mesophila]